MSNEHYVVMKLVSGETVMGTYGGEDDTYIRVDYPISIKNTIIPELQREQISATPLCAFTDSALFVLEKAHVVFIKRLSDVFIPHYKKFVQVYDEGKVPVGKDDYSGWDEELLNSIDGVGDMTAEEVHDTVNRLEAIMKGEQPAELEEENQRIVIDGNKTKH